MNLDELKSVLLDELGIKKEISLDTNLTTDLGLDSIDAISLITAIEKKLNIRFEDEVIPTLKTVGSVVDYINKLLKKWK